MKYNLERYSHLLDRLNSEDGKFERFDEGEMTGIVLRHDVDLSPLAALRMAKQEQNKDITSTYFFLLGESIYNAASREVRGIISQIERMGHEIGLHFNTHRYWETHPGKEQVQVAVQEECTILSALINGDVTVVSFHIPPSWVLGEQYSGFTSTYEPRFFGDHCYVSDSKQKWRQLNPFDGDVPQEHQVVIHPGLWSHQDAHLEPLYQAFQDKAIEEIHDYFEQFSVE